MYKVYGIHKSNWNKYKKLVIESNYDNIELYKEFRLDEKQIWFLFTKLLQEKYDHLYLRATMKKEDIGVGQYVYCKEYGNGEIIKLFEYELMFVKFEDKKLPVMCSQKGYTVHDDTKRKLTKR